jgi:hypothetical protein
LDGQVALVTGAARRELGEMTMTMLKALGIIGLIGIFFRHN